MSKFENEFKVPKIKTRESRVKREDQSRRLKRWSTVDATRQIQISPPTTPDKITKSQQRLQRLKQWQQERRKRLETEKKFKKPVWKCGIAPPPKQPPQNVSKNEYSSKLQHSDKLKPTQKKSPPKTRSRKVVVKPKVKTPPKRKSPTVFRPIKKVPRIGTPKKPFAFKPPGHLLRQTPKTSPNKLLNKSPMVFGESSIKKQTPKKLLPNKSPISKTPSKFSIKSPKFLVESVRSNQTPKLLKKLSPKSPVSLEPHVPVFNVPKTKGAVAKIHHKLLTRQLTPTQIVTRNSKKKILDESYQTFSTNSRKASTPREPKRPADGPYFESLLEMEIERLTTKIKEWEPVITNEVPTDIQDEILATIGQTKLLIAKKFEQFRGLTYGKNSEKEVQSSDLEGFWEMIYIQVDDLDKRYEKLKTLKDRDWVQEVEVVKAVKKVVKKTKTDAGPSKGLREAIEAARLAKVAQGSPNVKIFVQEKPVKKKRYTPFMLTVMRKQEEKENNTPVKQKLVGCVDSPKRTPRFRQQNLNNQVTT